MDVAVSCGLNSTHHGVFNGACAHGWTPFSPASLRPETDPLIQFGQAIACGCPSNDLVQQVMLSHEGSLPVRRGRALSLQTAFLFFTEQSDPDGKEATQHGPDAHSLHPDLNLLLKTRRQISPGHPRDNLFKTWKDLQGPPPTLSWACMENMEWSSQRYTEQEIHVLADFLWTYTSYMPICSNDVASFEKKEFKFTHTSKERSGIVHALPFQTCKCAPSGGTQRSFCTSLMRLTGTSHLQVLMKGLHLLLLVYTTLCREVPPETFRCLQLLPLHFSCPLFCITRSWPWSDRNIVLVNAL